MVLSAQATIRRSNSNRLNGRLPAGQLLLRSRTKTVTTPLSVPATRLCNLPLASFACRHHLTHWPPIFTLSRQHMTLSSGVWAPFASVIPDICHHQQASVYFFPVPLRGEAHHYRWTRGHTTGLEMLQRNKQGKHILGSRYTLRADAHEQSDRMNTTVPSLTTLHFDYQSCDNANITKAHLCLSPRTYHTNNPHPPRLWVTR